MFNFAELADVERQALGEESRSAPKLTEEQRRFVLRLETEAGLLGDG